MLTVRVVRSKMARYQTLRGRILHYAMVVVPLVVFIMFILQKYSTQFPGEWRQAFPAEFKMFGETPRRTTKTPRAGSCPIQKDCPEDHVSFYIQSGAANLVPPKICIQNKLVLGMVLNNGGIGINIVVLNAKTGEVTKTGTFNMYSDAVEPLIEFLKNIDEGSPVLIATYDEPATKLTDEARKLITELGSIYISSLGFRDNWVFVGGKGSNVRSNYEKHIKNDITKNKYENWPEMLELNGCIPNYLQ